MTKTVFYEKDGSYLGFSLSGHTAEDDSEEGRLVCSAVSSAAYLTANTVTDVLEAKAEVSVDSDSGAMTLVLLDHFSDCQPILIGFAQHMKQLSQQYPNFINITMEVL